MGFRRTAIFAFGFMLVLGLAGCNSSSSPGPPPPFEGHHMYLSTSGAPGTVQIYNLPVTATSTATGAVTGLNRPEELYVDHAGRLFVPINGNPANTGTTVQVYGTPLTSASTPAFTLTVSHAPPENTVEDSAGNVYVSVLPSSSCCIDIFPGPVTGNATAGSEITSNGVTPNGLGSPFGMAFDSSGNLYASSTTSIIKFTPPINSASTPAANVIPNVDNWGLLVDASNNVYVANATVDGTIDVFNQPFQNGSTRAFGILVTSGSSSFIQGMTFDASGNLWCTTGNGKVWEITAPITSSSTATNILTVTNAYGIVFGP